MKTKTFAIVLALVLAPGLAAAAGCSHGKDRQAMSCAEGTKYDAGSGSCQPVST